MSIALSINVSLLGDTIASIPTIRKISEAYQTPITIFSYFPDLFINHPCVDKTLHINDSKENYEILNTFTQKDILVEDKKVALKYAQIDIRQYHAISLGFNLTPKEMEMDLYIEENWDIGYKNFVLIHPSTTWASRTWDKNKWQELIYKLNENNIPVVAIGKNSKEEGFFKIDKPTLKLDIPYGIDLTNHPEDSLPKVRNLMNKARSLITMDSGMLHLAGTTDVEIIQLGSSIHPYYRAPYRKGTQDYKYTYVGGGCNLFCTSNMKHHLKEWGTIQGIPPLVGCLENKSKFECHPSPDKVLDIVLSQKTLPLPKLLIITPHLSTGGSPQYILDYLKYHKNLYSEIKLVEFTEFSWEYTIQKNKIIDLLGKENVITLGKFHVDEKTFSEDKKPLLSLIKAYSPDVVWMNECPEAYEYKLPPDYIIKSLYSKKRPYKIIETTHFNAFNFNHKKYIPDEFMFCSQKHLKDSKLIDIPKKVWEVPIELKTRPDRNKTLISLGLDPNKYHVLNVGIFNSNKNQEYIFKLAQQSLDLPIEFHFIGNHAFIKDTGITKFQKNLQNCKIWGERNDVDKFMSCMDLYLFPSKKELNPLSVKEALSWGMDVLANYDSNYTDQYKHLPNFNLIQNIQNFSSYMATKIPLKLPKSPIKPSLKQTKDHFSEYKISFLNGVKCEILSSIENFYKVKFFNHDTNELIWEDTIKNNMWTAPFAKYYIKWRIEIWQNGTCTKEYIFDCSNKKVYIHLDSKSLGDTIAWFPYIEEFRKKHSCQIICSTFKNHFFQSLYPEIEFIEPGTLVNGIYAQYNIGWFWDEGKNPNNVLNIPLQQTASDILGLEYKEIKPKLDLKPSTPNIKGKYVTLSIQSTAQSKYWNYKGGWQQVIDFLLKRGYKVVCIDQYSNFGVQGYMNSIPKKVINKTGCNFNEASSLIKNAQFHIGISSGLSWLAWALNTPVVMISSFTKSWFEFQSDCTRICNDTSKSGYFNTHRLDASNWNWYPFKKIKSMEDWYEIETITPEQVINNIKQLL